MKINSWLEDAPLLTQWEIGILLALMRGQTTGYRIARWCEEDLAGDLAISNGTLYPALKRLERARLVESFEPGTLLTGGRAKVYRATQLGRMVLEWHLATYRRLIKLGEARL